MTKPIVLIMYVNKEKVEIEDIDKFGTPINTKTL